MIYLYYNPVLEIDLLCVLFHVVVNSEIWYSDAGGRCVGIGSIFSWLSGLHGVQLYGKLPYIA